jgi:hypothetical protein
MLVLHRLCSSHYQCVSTIVFITTHRLWMCCNWTHKVWPKAQSLKLQPLNHLALPSAVHSTLLLGTTTPLVIVTYTTASHSAMHLQSLLCIIEILMLPCTMNTKRSASLCVCTEHICVTVVYCVCYRACAATGQPEFALTLLEEVRYVWLATYFIKKNEKKIPSCIIISIL